MESANSANSRQIEPPPTKLAKATSSEHARNELVRLPPVRPVVITLHGIKTRGRWQKDLDLLLSQAGFTTASLDYGNFLALQLLIPWSRRKKVEWLRDEYERRVPDDR